MAETTFTRKASSCTEISDVKEFLALYGNEILPIPSVDGIICYYQGKPVVKITDTNWYFFSSDYNKYLDEKVVCKKARCKSKKARKSFYMDNKSEILSAIKEGLKNDKERFSQQDIILRALNYQQDGFVFCGMETAIPSDELRSLCGDEIKKPEIDIVAIDPKQKKIILIEYKCQKSTLLDNAHNIEYHAKDYSLVKRWITEKDENLHFISGMLNAYKALCRIYGRSYTEADLQAEGYSVEIVFLLTNHPSEGKLPAKREQLLSEGAYISAKRKLCKPEIMEITENSYYLAYNKPEDILHFPSDILSEKYKGVDKLCWNKEWNR